MRAVLGVEPQPGGVHERMGTHNCLLKLGPSTYLEVIAINPQASPPGRPRWFGLDTAGSTPRLATWVAATANIAAAPVALGRAERFTRGPYTWQLTIPVDGRMPFDGVAPARIQWESEHVAARLEERGCSLAKLEGFHKDTDGLRRLLAGLNLEKDFELKNGEPGLVATIQTPSGARKLR